MLASLEGHTKRCTGVSWVSSDVIVSSSADKTARVWRAGGEGGSEWSCAAVLRDHTAEVVGVTTHPSRRYFVTGSTDASWAFYDVASLTCLRQVRHEAARHGRGPAWTRPAPLQLGIAHTHTCFCGRMSCHQLLT